MTADTTLRFLDHTADVGFEVRAGTRAGLFERAVEGLARLALGAETGSLDAGDRSTERIEAEAAEGGDDALLFAWLRELVFLLATRNTVPIGASGLEIEATRIRADVIFSGDATPVREIKGVTWHGLEVTEKDDGWYGRVVFDV